MTGFLFGKIPAFGDFVSRGLSTQMRHRWDAWCTTLLLDAQVRLADDFDTQYRRATPRCFLMTQEDSTAWQAGCVVASVDRAGRAFPFVLGISSRSPIEACAALEMGERIAAGVEAAFERQIDLDALVRWAAAAADDSAQPRRSLPLISQSGAGWIGALARTVEM